MTYADTCTRVYSPHGSTAHLSPPGIPLGPLCPASARPPRGGWLGTGQPAERDWAASLPTCKHCARLAAARTTGTWSDGPSLVELDAYGDYAPETPAGGERGSRAADDRSPLAGSTPVLGEPLEPLPAEDPAARRKAQRGLWGRALSAWKAGQRGDPGRRARRGRGPEYRPGQNRTGGPP